MMTTTTFSNTDDIARANRAIGHHWFDPDTMRWFKSKVYGSVHHGRYFISSEVPPYEKRQYTIRVANETGEVSTIGEVGQYATYKAAQKALDAMVAAGELPSYGPTTDAR